MTFTEYKAKYHLTLNPQQEAAVQAVYGPVLLLAVPGSGKTTTLVSRLGYMIFVCGIPPSQILTVTYTTAAASDMRQRFSALFSAALAGRMQFRTINSLCSHIISYYEQALQHKAFQLVEGSQQVELLREACRPSEQAFLSSGTLNTVQTWITYAKNQMLSMEEVDAIHVDGVDFGQTYRDYQRLLCNYRRMDYDDQLVYARQILLRHPSILIHFQQQYSYLCVDEAQDTSKIQHDIIRLLAGHKANLFMVGDEDQSIYGFRAAYPEALVQFEAQYPEARVLYMEQNYRSTRSIVEAANQFIRQNHNRHPKQMYAARGSGPALQALWVYDRQQQYQKLVSLLENCNMETAVLYRENDSALPLIDRLRRAGIPYRCRSLDSSFFTHRIVNDITDIIRFAQNPTSGSLFLRIYYKLGAKITRSIAEEAAAAVSEQPILTSMALRADLPAWLRKRCQELETHLACLLHERADRAIWRIRNVMGYGTYLEERGLDPNKALILELLGASDPDPIHLLTHLEELKQWLKNGSEADCPLFLSTIHSSKGLEFERVILMDVVDGLFPNTLLPTYGTVSVEQRAAYEEERRLFYVGMTRAKQELCVVRFQRADLSSQFAEALFPPAAPPSPRPSPMSSPPAARPKPLPLHQVTDDEQHYVTGVSLCHKTFGPGTLTARAGDIVTVRFASGTEKKFSLSATLRLQLFQRLPSSSKQAEDVQNASSSLISQENQVK